MRYDYITRDAVAQPGSEFTARPGTPATRTTPRFVRGDAVRVDVGSDRASVLESANDFGLERIPLDDGEDAVMPLFPEDAAFDDPNYVPDTSLPPLRGKVRIRLDEVAKRRGLILNQGRFKGTVNLSAIQRGTGMAYATVYKLLRQPDELTSVSLETLARLCEFFRCTPGDLLVWEPRAEKPDTNISDYFKRKEFGGMQAPDSSDGIY